MSLANQTNEPKAEKRSYRQLQVPNDLPGSRVLKDAHERMYDDVANAVGEHPYESIDEDSNINIDVFKQGQIRFYYDVDATEYLLVTRIADTLYKVVMTAIS